MRHLPVDCANIAPGTGRQMFSARHAPGLLNIFHYVTSFNLQQACGGDHIILNLHTRKRKLREVQSQFVVDPGLCLTCQSADFEKIS